VNLTDVPAISLFSGAGGLDLGVEDAGASIRACVEMDVDCVKTLRANARFFPDLEVMDRAIEEVTTEELLEVAGLKRGEAALLIGGPPCQPFSKAGYWLQDRRTKLEQDPRAQLPNEFLRVLKEAQPQAFVLENVASSTHPLHRAPFDRLVEGATDLGYAVDREVLHAVEFGVPQTRSRLFIIGLRGKAAPKFPKPTHSWDPHGKATAKLKAPQTAGRWIAALDTSDLHEPEEVVSGTHADALRKVPPGFNYNVLTEWAGHPDPLFEARSKFWSFLLKLSPYRPSWTIQAQPGPWTGPFHWNDRRLRIPELAALQTFPRGYQLEGARRSRMRQIGNAVPCLLASRVASAVIGEILGKKPKTGRRLRYKLAEGYEFDPSLAPHRGPRW
jgi:DNA (cytosine-5)-methyltransferase 1